MRLRWAACSLVVAGMLAVTTVRVEAQGLNDVLIRLLSNGCQGLRGSSGPYGPQLQDICFNAPSGPAATAGGTVGAETRGGGEEQRQIFRRLRQRQAAASADAGGAHGLSLFGSADYQKFDKDTTRFETGFERDTVGGTIGVDYLFRTGLVLGTAVSYAHEFGDYEGIGGGFDHDAYGILVYGSVVPFAGMFVDGVAGYTRKNYSFDRRASFSVQGTPFSAGSTSGDTDGNEFKVGVNTGYDFLLGRFTVGPRAGVLYRETTIDSFRESGGTGLELAYDNQNIQSLITTVGVYGSVALSTGFGVIVPQATAEYVHEFLDDQRSVGFSLVQDPLGARFLFQTDRPDRDYFNLGVGVAMVLPNGLQPFVNFRELVGYKDRSSHTVTLGLRVPF
jgi:outer membrane autotransporter protein